MAETKVDDVIEIRVEVDHVRSYGQLKEEFVTSFEVQLAKIILNRHSGNLSAASKSLRMDRKHLSDLATKHGLRQKPVKKPSEE
jgi:DNA-binding NtrC family response regulator